MQNEYNRYKVFVLMTDRCLPFAVGILSIFNFKLYYKLTYMVRLGMQITFGHVRRKTAPTGLE